MRTFIELLSDRNGADFAALLDAAGMSVADFSRAWGGGLADRVTTWINGTAPAPTWAILAAIHAAARPGDWSLPAPDADISHLLKFGELSAMCKRNRRPLDRAIAAETSRGRKAALMAKARDKRTASLTPEQRSARRAGYKIG